MEEKETKKVVRKPRRIQKDKMVKAKLYEEQVVEVKSVTKVNKGGRQRRFSALVVVGDRKGKVGIGMGKAAEVPDAIQKASQQATKKNMAESTIKALKEQKSPEYIAKLRGKTKEEILG